MGRDEQHGDPERTPVDFPEPVGLAWGSNIFDDREAGARAWGIVTRALTSGPSAAPAGPGAPAPRSTSER